MTVAELRADLEQARAALNESERLVREAGEQRDQAMATTDRALAVAEYLVRHCDALSDALVELHKLCDEHPKAVPTMRVRIVIAGAAAKALKKPRRKRTAKPPKPKPLERGSTCPRCGKTSLAAGRGKVLVCASCGFEGRVGQVP